MDLFLEGVFQYCFQGGRLNIEYLRYSFDFKKGGAKRHPQIFNRQSSIFNSGLSGLGDYFEIWAFTSIME